MTAPLPDAHRAPTHSDPPADSARPADPVPSDGPVEPEGDNVIRLVLADDQALVRVGFRMIIDAESDLSVVAEASNGVEAVEASRQHRPDVVVMDVRMPVMDGVEATRVVTSLPGPPRVLMVTTFDLDEYVHAALTAGASGFLLKDAPPEELVNAIRVVDSGNALLAPTVTRRLIEEFTARPHPEPPGVPAATDPDPLIATLTSRELEVLEHVAQGLSNAEIAEALFVGATTVKTHVGRILMKLGLRDRVQAVVFAYEHGVVHRGH